MRDPQGLLLLIALALGVVVLFAVTRLFAIASTLVEIRDELRLARRERGSTLCEAPAARKALAIGGLLFAMVGFSTAVHADVLVLVDGSRIETRGPWASNGQFAAYFPLKGNARVIRASEIDPEATKLATMLAARAEAQKKQAAAGPAKPRFVINDAMVGHVDPQVMHDKIAADEERAKREEIRREQQSLSALRQKLSAGGEVLANLRAQDACKAKYGSAVGVGYELCVSNALH